MGCAGTRGYNSHIGPFGTKLNSDISGRHIAQHHRHKKRTDTRGPLFHHDAVIFMSSIDAALAAAKVNTKHIPINRFNVQFCILNSQTGCCYCKMNKPIGSSCIFFIKPLLWIKVLHFGRDIDSMPLCIKEGDLPCAVLSGRKSTPIILFTATDGTDGP